MNSQDFPVAEALLQVKQALQDAHFAARRLDVLLGVPFDARHADEVHAARIQAGELSRRIAAMLTSLA